MEALIMSAISCWMTWWSRRRCVVRAESPRSTRALAAGPHAGPLQVTGRWRALPIPLLFFARNALLSVLAIELGIIVCLLALAESVSSALSQKLLLTRADRAYERVHFSDFTADSVRERTNLESIAK